MRKKMKKYIIIALESFIIASLLLFGCTRSSDNVDTARNDVKDSKESVAEANVHLQQAIADSAADFQRYKAESETRIKDYEKNIADLKVKIAKEKKDGNKNNTVLIDELERKAIVMKEDLKRFEAEKQGNWAEFKINFNKNMDELGQAIANFFTNEKPKK